MSICPFMQKECLIDAGSKEECKFEILPHSNEKPFGKRDCAIRDAVLLYILERKPGTEF